MRVQDVLKVIGKKVWFIQSYDLGQDRIEGIQTHGDQIYFTLETHGNVTDVYFERQEAITAYHKMLKDESEKRALHYREEHRKIEEKENRFDEMLSALHDALIDFKKEKIPAICQDKLGINEHRSSNPHMIFLGHFDDDDDE